MGDGHNNNTGTCDDRDDRNDGSKNLIEPLPSLIYEQHVYNVDDPFQLADPGLPLLFTRSRNVNASHSAELCIIRVLRTESNTGGPLKFELRMGSGTATMILNENEIL